MSGNNNNNNNNNKDNNTSDSSGAVLLPKGSLVSIRYTIHKATKAQTLAPFVYMVPDEREVEQYVETHGNKTIPNNLTMLR